MSIAGPSRSDAFALWIACAVPACYVVVSLLLLPSRFVSLNVEDGVGEMTGAACLFAAAWLAGGEARGARREGGAWRIPALFAAGALLVALEEISWGQRLLGWELPALQSLNQQGEINLHNLAFLHVWQMAVWPVFAVGGATLGVVARWSDRVRAWLAARAVPTPPLYVLPLLLTSAVIVFQEPAEMLFGLAMVVTAALQRAHARSAGGARRAWVAVVTSVSVALALVEFGPDSGREISRQGHTLQIAEGAYPWMGMLDNARQLLLAEARRTESGPTFGSASGPLSSIAIQEWRQGEAGEPSPAFLRQSIHRGLLHDAMTSIDLAVLYRLAGQPEEAERRLVQAEEPLDQYQRESPAGGGTHPIERVARARLLAARGRQVEAQALLRERFRGVLLLIHAARVRDVQAIFAGQARPAEPLGDAG